MTTIVTRAGKGSPLTNNEMDSNLTNLNTYKVETNNPSTTGTLTHSGDIVLSGSGKRITGDFSNATVANRVMFQTSTVNGNTQLRVIPNGTGKAASIQAGNSSDPSNSSMAILAATATDVQLISTSNGAGALLPMTFYTGGSEWLRIGTSGQLGLGGSNYGTSGQALTSNGPGAAPTWKSISGLPSQTGNSGKYLTTNGSSASWVTVPQAKAWVNFDGTATGTITPRANYNVGSVTKSATGTYTLNFTSALTDTNYAAVAGTNVITSNGTAYSGCLRIGSTTKTTTALSVDMWVAAGLADASQLSVVIFGN